MRWNRYVKDKVMTVRSLGMKLFDFCWEAYLYLKDEFCKLPNINTFFALVYDKSLRVAKGVARNGFWDQIFAVIFF